MKVLLGNEVHPTHLAYHLGTRMNLYFTFTIIRVQEGTSNSPLLSLWYIYYNKGTSKYLYLPASIIRVQTDSYKPYGFLLNPVIYHCYVLFCLYAYIHLYEKICLNQQVTLTSAIILGTSWYLYLISTINRVPEITSHSPLLSLVYQ